MSGPADSAVFMTKYQLMLSAGIDRSVSVCLSREIALAGGLAGKAGVLAIPSELRVRFSRSSSLHAKGHLF